MEQTLYREPQSTMSSTAQTIQDQVHALADQLSPQSTWADVKYHVALCESIERGLADADAGKVFTHEEILHEFGLAE